MHSHRSKMHYIRIYPLFCFRILPLTGCWTKPFSEQTLTVWASDPSTDCDFFSRVQVQQNLQQLLAQWQTMKVGAVGEGEFVGVCVVCV